MLLYPGVGDTSEQDAYPQMIAELKDTTITDLTVSKTISLNSTPGVSGNLRVGFVSSGPTTGSAVLLKSSALRSEGATFDQFSVSEMNSSDTFGQFEIESRGPVTLGGSGSKPVQIRAHYLATNSISLSNIKLGACYDPDDDGTYEYGTCVGTVPDWGASTNMSGNEAPSPAAIVTPNPALVGETISFDGSASFDPDGSIQSYKWTFEDGTTSSSSVTSRTYNTPGNYTVTLTVTDDDGASATDTVVATVESHDPTADATANRTSVITGDAIAFDGSNSSDPDGPIASYNWTFGDNATATGATPVHTYSSPGTYTVNLTVTDDSGITDTDHLTITVDSNSPPTASATANRTSVITDDPIAFDGTGSSDSDGSISTYQWDFGDNATATGATPTHAYGSSGNYTVALTVTDDKGATATDTLEVTVGSNAAPTASASSNRTTVVTNQAIGFDGTGSSDSDGSISSYQWDFGDNATATGATPTHEYSSSGNYTVTLTVTDNDGATGTDTLALSVDANTAPTATATANQTTATVNETISFDGSGSADSDGSIVSYQWDFGDGVTATGVAPTHQYSSTGNYTVTLTVTDDSGATATDTVAITIN
ncbi:MAG: PKD domain-containing protein [Halorientalis sp.]